jgi:hypothetical protein
MDDIKKFLKRVWCFLTGGHQYEVETLHSTYYPKTGLFLFRNYCAKCGKWDKWVVPADNIMPELVRNTEVAWDE